MKNKALMGTVFLLIISVVMNFVLIFDHYPMPKESSSLKWNENYAYTLAYPDDESGSIIISFDEKYNPKQYFKLDGVYKQILMTSNGLIVSNDTESISFAVKDGVLEKDEKAPSYNLSDFITSELSIGDGLEVHKRVDASNIKDEALKTEIQRDFDIFQIYPVKYEKAFVIDGVNYIPRDFDSIDLHK